MMSIKTIRFYSLLILICALLANCSSEKGKSEYTKVNENIHYKLLSFSSENKTEFKNGYLHLQVKYCKQNDSVFWDSTSDFYDRLLANITDTRDHGYLSAIMERLSVGDSVCLLVKKESLFHDCFYKDKAPTFTGKDSAVKVYLKVKGYFNPEQMDSLNAVWEFSEKKMIEDFLLRGSFKTVHKDSLGVVWIEGYDKTNSRVPVNKMAVVGYQGFTLEGEEFDESPVDFQVNTATPDQVLKGINYVIKYLNKGENAKIILPSYLAFGKNGSGSIIPPFCPLLYKVSINETINKNE